MNFIQNNLFEYVDYLQVFCRFFVHFFKPMVIFNFHCTCAFCQPKFFQSDQCN